MPLELWRNYFKFFIAALKSSPMNTLKFSMPTVALGFNVTYVLAASILLQSKARLSVVQYTLVVFPADFFLVVPARGSRLM